MYSSSSVIDNDTCSFGLLLKWNCGRYKLISKYERRQIFVGNKIFSSILTGLPTLLLRGFLADVLAGWCGKKNTGGLKLWSHFALLLWKNGDSLVDSCGSSFPPWVSLQLGNTGLQVAATWLPSLGCYSSSSIWQTLIYWVPRIRQNLFLRELPERDGKSKQLSTGIKQNDASCLLQTTLADAGGVSRESLRGVRKEYSDVILELSLTNDHFLISISCIGALS